MSFSDTASRDATWRVANLLIRRFGLDAEEEAARRACLMLARGDRGGHRGWIRVMDAIAGLQAQENDLPH
jgi:hypothetical protein